MLSFRSYQAKLQAAFFTLALAAIGVTGYEASVGAASALRNENLNRLTAIRDTKRRQVERYFQELRNHVLALSSDESTIEALEQLRAAWSSLPELASGQPREQRLRQFYETQFAPTVAREARVEDVLREWYPTEPRWRGLQAMFLSENSYSVGSKDQLLLPRGGGRYGEIHARFHPTLHRYQSAFGFYDIFLIDGEQGKVLYSVFKEIDLGAPLRRAPYEATGLGRAFARAMALATPEQTVTEDFQFYMPSHLAPAAFVAAPVWRAGAKIGVLAIQVPIHEIDRVINSERNWRQEGMGESGRAYLVGPDNTFRSSDRLEIERPDEYYRNLYQAGIAEALVARAERNHTGILTVPVAKEVADARRVGQGGAGAGKDISGRRVFRSYAPVNAAELKWMLVAEMDEAEVLGPVDALRRRVLGVGLLIALVFLQVAWWLARSVTQPVLRLSEAARRLGQGDFHAPVPADSKDEIGQLAQSFRRMADDLERTTVRRDELDRANQELHQLTERLIEAQEQERQRLARELHDDMTQRLAAIAIDAGVLRHSAGDEDRVREGLDRIGRQIGELSGDVHSLSRRLHPAMLEDLGLATAVEGECRSFFERGGPPVDLRISGELSGLTKETQLGLYRIVQEALRNILRHAGAENVQVSLAVDAGHVTLEVSDDGRGFDATARCRGLGLSSMKERTRLLKGNFVMDSAPGEGTRIRVRVPVMGRLG